MDAVLYGLLSSKIEGGGGGDEGEKLYLHVLKLEEQSYADYQRYSCLIITRDSTPFTTESLFSFLRDNKFDNKTKRVYPATGTDIASNIRIAVGLFAHLDNSKAFIEWAQTAATASTAWANGSISRLDDTVIEL